jgi:uncharacterized protein HemX
VSADRRPELRAVSAQDGYPVDSELDAAPRAEESRHATPVRQIGLTLLLVFALVAACVGYFYQQRRAEVFAIQVSSLQTELQQARQDLRAHEERMQAVRGQVDDLAGRVGLLQQFIALDPAAD